MSYYDDDLYYDFSDFYNDYEYDSSSNSYNNSEYDSSLLASNSTYYSGIYDFDSTPYGTPDNYASYDPPNYYIDSSTDTDDSVYWPPATSSQPDTSWSTDTGYDDGADDSASWYSPPSYYDSSYYYTTWTRWTPVTTAPRSVSPPPARYSGAPSLAVAPPPAPVIPAAPAVPLAPAAAGGPMTVPSLISGPGVTVLDTNPAFRNAVVSTLWLPADPALVFTPDPATAATDATASFTIAAGTEHLLPVQLSADTIYNIATSGSVYSISLVDARKRLTNINRFNSSDSRSFHTEPFHPVQSGLFYIDVLAQPGKAGSIVSGTVTADLHGNNRNDHLAAAGLPAATPGKTANP